MSTPPDIRLRLDCPDHAKFDDLAALCGTTHEPFRCWVRLLCSLAQHDKNRVDGILRGLDEAAIERRAKWKGNVGVFVAALVTVKLLDRVGNDFEVHDWLVHQEFVAEYNAFCALQREKSSKAAKMRRAAAGDKSTAQPAGASNGAPNGIPAGTPPTVSTVPSLPSISSDTAVAPPTCTLSPFAAPPRTNGGNGGSSRNSLNGNDEDGWRRFTRVLAVHGFSADEIQTLTRMARTAHPNASEEKLVLLLAVLIDAKRPGKVQDIPRFFNTCLTKLEFEPSDESHRLAKNSFFA